MRITLVHPAGFNFVPGQPDFSVLANRMMPIGILTLAAWLEKHGHPTAVHDCLGPCAPPPARANAIEANADIILATKPEIVGFSATTSAFMDAIEITRAIRRKQPQIKVVFGNVHASSLGAPLLERFPEIDYLCIGEGEGMLLDMAEGKALCDISNLAPSRSRARRSIAPSQPPRALRFQPARRVRTGKAAPRRAPALRVHSWAPWCGRAPAPACPAHPSAALRCAAKAPYPSSCGRPPSPPRPKPCESWRFRCAAKADPRGRRNAIRRSARVPAPRCSTR